MRGRVSFHVPHPTNPGQIQSAVDSRTGSAFQTPRNQTTTRRMLGYAGTDAGALSQLRGLLTQRPARTALSE
jgi:hypothetical protein